MAQDTNMIYKFLLTADSIYGPEVQGFAEPHFSFDQGGQSVFTKDGSRFATTCRGTKKIFVADFDRCTGLLSAPLVYNVSSENAHNPNNPGQTDEMTEGLAFSPNGQYLYVAQHFNIRQLDLLDSNPKTAWSTVAGLDTTWDQFPIYSSMYLGPDDKLYLGYWSNMGGSQSYFDFPDNKGAASGFCRRCLRFPGIHNNGNPFNQGVTTPPSMPNYKLGAASPICWPTEVKDVKVLTDAFKVYPNPTNGELTAEYDWPGVLEILDVYGRIVHSTRLGESCRTTSISSAHLQSGLYLYNYRVKGSILHFGKLLLK